MVKSFHRVSLYTTSNENCRFFAVFIYCVLFRSSLSIIAIIKFNDIVVEDRCIWCRYFRESDKCFENKVKISKRRTHLDPSAVCVCVCTTAECQKVAQPITFAKCLERRTLIDCVFPNDYRSNVPTNEFNFVNKFSIY